MDIREQIEHYVPFNEQEEIDKEQLLRWIDTGLNLWTRENGMAHWTASAWVTDQTHQNILMCWHNIYQSWAWLGGHADGDHDLLRVSLREVQEESGLHEIIPLTTNIFSIEILTVDGHIKKGTYVSSHLHLNVTYLLEADSHEPIRPKEDENKAVAWFTKDEAVEKSTEPWFQEHVYTKLNQKMTEFFNEKGKV